MNELRKLFVTVGANVEGFKKGMGEVQAGLASTGKNISQTGKTMTKWVTGPIAAVGVGLVALAKTTANYGDNVAKTAAEVGTSIEAYQEMEYALGQLGMEQAGVDRALGRLNQRIGRAREGNEQYAKSLADVGVDMQALESGTLSTEDAFMQAIQTLHEMEDAQRQSALAGELFGTKIARELMPAIKAGGEELANLRDRAHELGMVMDEDAARASEKFNDSLDDLQRSFQGIIRELGAELIPLMTDHLFPVIQDKVVPAIRDLVGRITDLVKWFADLDPRWQKIIVAAVGFAAALGPTLVVVGNFLVILGKLIPAIKGVGLTLGALFAGPAAPFIIAIAVIAGLVAAWYAFGDDLKLGAKLMWDGIKSAWDRIISFLDSINLFRIGRDIIMSLADGIRDSLRAVVDAAKNIGRSIADSVKGALGISSPSKIMIELGENIGQGLEIGMNRSMPDLALAGHSYTISNNTTIHSPVAMDAGQIKRQQEKSMRKLALEWGVRGD